MKRMEPKLLIAILSIVLAAAVVAWLACRRSETASPTPAVKAAEPKDAWMKDVKLNSVPDYRVKEADRERLMEKLRAEERRQEPGKGRN